MADNDLAPALEEAGPIVRPMLQLSPEESQSVYGGGMGPDVIGANLLWKLGKDVWSLVKAPGQVYSGELQPSMTPGPNQLSVPEYAQHLFGYGLGAGGLMTGGAIDAATMRQFGAWHGTRAAPFREFSDEYLRSGEGHMTYGHGHYVGGAEETGATYRRQVAGSRPVPIGEDGVPLTDDQLAEKYYRPGDVIRSRVGFDKVIEFKPSVYGPGGDYTPWSVKVQSVTPKRDPGVNLDDVINHPDLWEPVAGERWHRTMPDDMDLVDAARKRPEDWKFGQPGALIHVNVKPEENEFLDWDEMYEHQDPGVKKKLRDWDPPGPPAGISQWGRTDPMMKKGDWSKWLDEEDPTGAQIYKKMFEEHKRAGLQWDDAWQATSLDLSDMGIPGNKYLDALSRGKTDDLKFGHTNNFQDAPIDNYFKSLPVNMAEKYMKRKKFSPGTTMGSALDEVKGDVLDDIDEHNDFIANTTKDMQKKYGYSPAREGFKETLDSIDIKKRFLNWLDQEHKVGNLSLSDGRTRNYVVFDPKNLEIRTWNGRKLEPVDHDPFGGGE